MCRCGVDRSSENLLEQLGQIRAGSAGAGGAAFGRLFGAAHVGQAFDRQIGAHVHKMIRFIGAADPRKFAPVVFDLRLFKQLVKIDRRLDRADCQTIPFGDAIDVIGPDDRPGAGHVLNDEVGIARNMFAHVLGHQTRVEIVGAPGAGASYHRNGLALVERLRLRRSSDQQKAEEKKPTICHYYEDLLK